MPAWPIALLAILRGTLKVARDFGRRNGAGEQVEGDSGMKSVAVVAGIVAVVIGVAFLANQVTAASGPASLPVAYGFDASSGWADGQVKPDAIYFGAGGNLLVRGLRWLRWTREAALGRGLRWSDSCVPSCAAGRYIKVPVVMSLSRVRTRDGVGYFSRMTLKWAIDGRRYKTVYSWTLAKIPDALPFWS